ncbi:unnamed protein product [Bemisia tabaci]|uniref:BZIP domain-containing protein n=1 Tax=Bemisia tabaci TaxID=7038 RepID=A0A9P0G4I6_BEMTA|nr:PREDICTED: transcription factor kayak isoform X2 [Bemisia tabaci]CAH0773985.1 unnamed protein product [Bemisia tabaci]
MMQAQMNILHSGVPTRTTPTLTPTTLRKFEQTLLDLEGEVRPHQNEARFVPPPLDPSMSQNGNILLSFVDTKSWQGSTVNSVPLTPIPTVKSPPIQNLQNQNPNPNPTRKSMGGRRPIKDKSISPEEEERRQVRRERNKLAAARCRKRRLDHTNELLEETEGLEEKKQMLQNELTLLQREKEELESLLESHEPACLLKNANPTSTESIDMKPPPILYIKPDPDSDVDGPLKSKLDPIISNPMLSQQPSQKPFSNQRVRPNSLPVSSGFTPSHRPAEMMDIPVSAATVMPLNFDSLMEGGTGLTPVSGPLVPSCSSQQRNMGCVDLSSPDSASSKLVSL